MDTTAVRTGQNAPAGVIPWSDETVAGLKIFVVALVIAGLATACIFSGMAAVGAGSLAATIIFGSISGVTGFGAVIAPFVAHHNDMGKSTGKNWEDTANFIGFTVGSVFVLFVVAICACTDNRRHRPHRR